MIMKTRLTPYFITLLFVTICIQLYSCQTDDRDQLEAQSSHHRNHATVKTISGKDIPEILQVIKKESNKDLKFSLTPSQGLSRSTESTISGTLNTDKIRQVTDHEGKSNYTFSLTKEGEITEFSVVNYVLKESGSGYYSYFLEFMPDENWLRTTPNPNDLLVFTGTLIVYDRYGVYVGENEFINGVRTAQLVRTACPDDDDDNTTGGGGNEGPNTSDNPSNDDGSDSSDSSEGTHGHNIEVDITCGCAPGHDGGNSNDSCSCTVTDIIININFADQNDDPIAKTPLRNPCPPIVDTCNSQNDCEYGFDLNCDCLPNPSDEENSSDGIILSLDIIMDLNALLGTNDSYIYPADVNPDDAHYFDTVDQFSEFLQNPELDLSQPLIDTDEGNRITTFRVDYGLTNLDLFVNQILNNPIENQEYEFIEVTSELSGITIGSSWEQTAVEHVIVGNEAIITVFGSLNFNLFIESIGTIYTDVKIFELHIDINTGEPISIFDIED
ncbi:MAG: hypothetical protein ACI9Y7_000716 [Dokdonia sp.]|jgi:hypothetical protein